LPGSISKLSAYNFTGESRSFAESPKPLIGKEEISSEISRLKQLKEETIKKAEETEETISVKNLEDIAAHFDGRIRELEQALEKLS